MFLPSRIDARSIPALESVRRWTLAQSVADAAADFAAVKLVHSEVAENFVAFMARESADQRPAIAAGLAEAQFTAVGLERLPDLDPAWYGKWRAFRMAAPQRDKWRREMRDPTRIAEAFCAVCGRLSKRPGVVKRLRAGQILHSVPAGPFVVVTECEVLRVRRAVDYFHTVYFNDKAILTNINLLALRGISSGTEWEDIIANDVDATADAIVKVMGHFLDDAESILTAGSAGPAR